MIKSLIVALLEAVDIFAIMPATLLTYKGKLTYSTIYTKTLTVFVVIVSILGFCYFSLNFLQKSNPQNVLSEEYSLNPPPVQMNRELFLLNFAMQNKSNNLAPFWDETIYIPEVFISKRQNEETVNSSVKIRHCTLEDLPSEDLELKSYFEQRHYEDMYCFQNYSEILVNGTWDSDIFKELLISIRICDNTTDNGTCKSEEIIRKTIEGSFIVIQHTSVILDLNNYESPLKVFAMNNFQPVSLNLATSMYLSFGQVSLETDIGYVSRDIDHKEGISLISQKNNLYKSDDGTFIKVYVRLDRIKKKIFRSYAKLQDVLSMVGGLMRFLTFFGSLLLHPFLKEALLQKVGNDTFDYGDFFNENRDNTSVRNTQKLKLSYWQYLKSKLKSEKKFTRRSELFYRSISEMKRCLDILNMMNKFIDIDNVRNAMENQQLLKSVSKPKLQTYLLTEESKNESFKSHYLNSKTNEIKSIKNNEKSLFSPKAVCLTENSTMKKFIFGENLEEKKLEKRNTNKKFSIMLCNSKSMKESEELNNENISSPASQNVNEILGFDQKGQFFNEKKMQSEGLNKAINFSLECDLANKKQIFNQKD